MSSNYPFARELKKRTLHPIDLEVEFLHGLALLFKFQETVMRVAIMQPTYLPWCGYFEMISSADVFVLLDNVQFERSSWQHRNRIKGPSGEVLLTLPVKSANKFPQLIRDVELSNPTHDLQKHLKAIELYYSKAPNYLTLIDEIRNAYNFRGTKLSEFNERFIRLICKELKIKTKIIKGSDLIAKGRKAELSLNQCLELNATVFYAARGSKEYVDLEKGFQENNIKVEYQNYMQPVYPQLFADFIPQLSVIDLLFNCGQMSMEIINTGKIYSD